MPLPLPSPFPKVAFAGGFVLAVGAATSHGAVIVTNFNVPYTLSSGSQSNTLSFNVGTGEVLFNTTNADSVFQINYDQGALNGSTGKPRLTSISGQPGTVLFTGTNHNSDVINNAPGTVISQDSGRTDQYGNQNTQEQSFVQGSTTQPYLSFNQDATSQFRYGITGYAAMQIIDPINSYQIDYAYAAITVNADNSVSLNRLAYDNTGAPIMVMAIPEPSTLATSLLALGATAARRRRALKRVTR